MSKKTFNLIKWSARITSLLIFLFIFPFYIGYGLPLPHSSMSIFEITWLIILPIFLISLLIGWKWPKIAGFLIIISILFGFIVGLFFSQNPNLIMALPLIPGILYLISAYNQ